MFKRLVNCEVLLFPAWTCHQCLLATREEACYIISVVSVCLSVCLSDDNFRTTWRREVHICTSSMSSRNTGQVIYEGHRVKVKVTGAKRSKRKSLFPQYKTSINHNSGVIKHRTMRFTCSMEFSAVADRVVWPPSSSHDRKRPRVTKMHAFAGGRPCIRRQSCC